MFRASVALQTPKESLMLVEPNEVQLVVDALFNAHQEFYKKGSQLVIGVDTETTGLHLIKDRIIVFSFYAPIWYSIPQLGLNSNRIAFTVLGPLCDRPENLEVFRPILESTEIIKCGANFYGFDWFMFRNHGIITADPIHDITAMDFLYTENFAGQHGLKAQTRRYFGHYMRDYKAAGGGQMDLRNWPLEAATTYPAHDAYYTFYCWEFLRNRLQELIIGETSQGSPITGWSLYTDFYIPLQTVLQKMMGRGVQIDMDYLNDLAPEISQELFEIERSINRVWTQKQLELNKIYVSEGEQKSDNIRARSGKPTKFIGGGVRMLNLNSINQLRFLFFELLGHEPLSMTKPGKRSGKQMPSLNKEVLGEYADQGCEHSAELLRYRELSKLYGTYIGDEADDTENIGKREESGGLRSKVINNRIYTHFKFGPVTGRLASSGPNLMNIPIRSKLGKKIRQAFIAAPGCKLIGADYSQLEMRLFASAANEQSMIGAIIDGRDMHCFTAALMYGISYTEIVEAKHAAETEQPLTERQKHLLTLRQAAKTIGFGEEPVTTM